MYVCKNQLLAANVSKSMCFLALRGPVHFSTPLCPVRRTLVQDDLVPSPILDMRSEPDTDK